MRALPSRASFGSLTSPGVAADFVAADFGACVPFVSGLPLFLTSRDVLRTAMETPCVKAIRVVGTVRGCTTASARTSHFQSAVLGCYADAYETDHAPDRAVAARRVAPPCRRRGPHAHRGAGACVARRPRVAARDEAAARGAPLLRPGPVPRRPRAAGQAPAAGGRGVIAVDAGLLVLGVNRYAPEHARAAELLETLANGDAEWALPWSAVHEYLAFVTHPYAVARVLGADAAWGFVRSLAESPGLRFLGPTERHAATCAEVLSLRDATVTGGLDPSFETAVILREHGVRELLSTDPGMSRWRFLDVRDPLKGEPWSPGSRPARRYRTLTRRKPSGDRKSTRLNSSHA